MFRTLRRLLIIAVIAGFYAGPVSRASADDDELAPPISIKAPAEEASDDGGDPVKPVPQKRTAGDGSGENPGVKSLLPPPESLIPRFEPETAEDGGPDTGFTPPRWLDQNDLFLSEADPFLPGMDPYRERPGLAPGWFAGIDLTVVHPEIDSQTNNRNLGPGDPFHGTFTNSTQLPVGDMNWSVMPKVYLGYRRENGLGEFITSYRYFQADSNGTLLNFDTAGAGQLQTRSQAHVLDFMYAFSDRSDGLPAILPAFRRYGLGLRVASWIYDTTASGQQTLEERAGNVFIGGGPVLDFEGTWLTPWRSTTFDAGLDVAGIGGFNYQRFAETAIVSGTVQSARGRTDGTGTATPILRVWGGVSWVPDWRGPPLRFSAGYSWERWFNLPDAGGQNDLTLAGPFVRGEFRW